MDQRKRRRIVGRILSISTLLGAALLISLGFVPKPVPVVTGKVEKRRLEVTVDESGKTRIRSRYLVSAPVVGNMARITLRPGDSVEVGDVLVQISPVAPGLLDQRTRSEAVARAAMSDANLQRSRVTVKRSEVALSFARDEATRHRALHAGNGASKQSLDQSEFQLRAAEEDYAAAQFGERVASNELAMARAAIASMSDTSRAPAALTLKAPISGRVLRVLQESEGVVQPGMALIEVGDPTKLEIVVDVLSTEAVKIAEGAVARIERWGGEVPLEARVRRKEPSAFTTRSALGVEEQRVPILLDPMGPPDGWNALSDGYRVEAKIRVSMLEDALVAPASATFRTDGNWAAYIIRNGKAEKVSLELGARTPDWVQVFQGVSEDVHVILYPSDQVHEGVDVAPSS